MRYIVCNVVLMKKATTVSVFICRFYRWNYWFYHNDIIDMLNIMLCD